MARRTPQEKKRLSYRKDRRNVHGEKAAERIGRIRRRLREPAP
ncbi:hypothetical protein [Actinomadura sp. HBU206391]|nr:hypothetical protein [Actinomadura sp. HBU206391]